MPGIMGSLARIRNRLTLTKTYKKNAQKKNKKIKKKKKKGTMRNPISRSAKKLTHQKAWIQPEYLEQVYSTHRSLQR
jgi:hypothetical protein